MDGTGREDASRIRFGLADLGHGCLDANQGKGIPGSGEIARSPGGWEAQKRNAARQRHAARRLSDQSAALRRMLNISVRYSTRGVLLTPALAMRVFSSSEAMKA